MSRRLLASALALSLGLTPVAPPGAQALNLPEMGDPSQAYFGSDEERRMGLEMMRQLRQRGMVLDDAQLTAYLNSIGQSIVTYADQNGVPFTFFAVRSAGINAFALPHNFIGINAGLILATEREDELAGVIAHEIAHVSQKHIVRAIADMKRMAIPLAAAMVASAALAAASKQAGQAAMVGSMAAGAQHQINFTRANEQEADRIGMRLLAKAGFDPRGMSDFFAKLERQAGGSSDQIPEMLLTHPRPERRAADTQDRIEAPPTTRRAAPRDRKAYDLAKARARVLVADDVRGSLKELEVRLAKGDGGSEAAARYARALALRQTARYDEAQQQIAQLLRNDPDRLAYRIEAAELALVKGDAAEGWRQFEEARALYPDDFVLAMHYGRALATQGDPRRALRVLQPHLSRHPNDPSLYASYAQAAQRGGDMAATHATMAEYHYLNGELLPAIEQLEMGLRSAGLSPNQQAQLRARLKQLRAEAIAQNLPVSKRDSP
ncbi:MAG: M48 family metallopeptidase [Candidatus Competibacteraceae bacterium]|nr:M48 family metallopeptidase [Candidatus Competibacteraceae bacterium]